MKTSWAVPVAALAGRTASTPVPQYMFVDAEPAVDLPAATAPAEPTTKRRTVQIASRFIVTQTTPLAGGCHLTSSGVREHWPRRVS